MKLYKTLVFISGLLYFFTFIATLTVFPVTIVEAIAFCAGLLSSVYMIATSYLWLQRKPICVVPVDKSFR